jgi:hypothetical protein
MKIDVIPLSIHKQFILTESCEADKILSHVSVLMFTVQKVVLLLLQSCEHGFDENIKSWNSIIQNKK